MSGRGSGTNDRAARVSTPARVTTAGGNARAQYDRSWSSTAALRSCSVAVSDVANAEITTIEGLSADGSHPVQKAWLAEDVPQCGYCQSGQIMAAAAFLKDTPNPTDADIDDGITNICRCGTYPRIRAAIHRAAALMKA